MFIEHAGTVEPRMFFDKKHGKIWEGIMAIADSGEMNILSLIEELKTRGTFEFIGPVRLAEATGGTETPARTPIFARILKEKFQLREIILKVSEVKKHAQDEDKKPQDLLVDLQGLAVNLAPPDTQQTVGDTVDNLMSDLKATEEGTFVPDGIRTGITAIDYHLSQGSLLNGELMIISAPTSCGKSQLALNIATKVAIDDGKPVAILSLEMGRKQILRRMMATYSGIDLRSPPYDMESLNYVAQKFKESKLHTIHSVKDMADLSSRLRSLHEKEPLGLFVLDYLQLMPIPTGSERNKAAAIAEMSHATKRLAMEMDIPIVSLSQVNREGAKRAGGLTVHDLKESGDIENDGDFIFLMWPQGGDMSKCKLNVPGKQVYELSYRVGKNREGPKDATGKIRFDGGTGKFE
jgi:replicative DNA helicase